MANLIISQTMKIMIWRNKDKSNFSRQIVVDKVPPKK